MAKQAWLAKAAESFPSWSKPAPLGSVQPTYAAEGPTTTSEDAAKQAWMARTEASGQASRSGPGRIGRTGHGLPLHRSHSSDPRLHRREAGLVREGGDCEPRELAAGQSRCAGGRRTTAADDWGASGIADLQHRR